MSTVPQVVTVAISGSPNRYVSTQGFVSSAGDTPAHTPFLPRIRGVLTYDRQVGCTVWGNSESAAAIGAIDIDNTDGALDSWLAEQWRDRIVEIRRGLATQAYDDHEHVAFAVVDRVTSPDFYTIRLGLRDKGALLDIPLQTEMYDFIANAPQLENTPKPVLIGECEGVPLTLIEALNLNYDLSDSELFAVDEVTDQGVILTEGAQWEVSATELGVTRLTNPAGKQVAKARGAMSGSVLIERLPDVLTYLLDRTGGRVYPDEQDPYSADALDTVAPYSLSYWGRDSTTISSVLTQMLDSFTGWWYFDRLGLLRVGRLEGSEVYDPDDPNHAGLVHLDDTNIIGDITIRLDTAPGLSDGVTAQRNWSPHTEGEIAGRVQAEEPDRAARLAGEYQVRRTATSLHPSYAHAVGAAPIRTLLSDPDDAQAEANRLGGIYSTEQYFYDLTAALEGSLAYTLEPGDRMVLHSERYGLTTGKIFMVASVNTSLMSNLVGLTLCGEGPQPGDF